MLEIKCEAQESQLESDKFSLEKEIKVKNNLLKEWESGCNRQLVR